jgi:hypothetical protein
MYFTRGNSPLPDVPAGSPEPAAAGWRKLSFASPIHRIAAFVFFIFFAFFHCGCGSDDKAKETAEAAPTGIEKKFERGPISVRIHLDKKEATIAERLNLTLEVISEEDYEVRLPAFGEKLEQFGIVDYRTPQPELVEDNKTRQSRSYVLEPFLSGEYVIPPMKVEFWKKDEADGQRHELETEAIKVNITSLLAEDLANLEIHDIEGPVELPRVKIASDPAFIIAIITLLILVSALIIWLLSRRRQAAPVVRMPAHEIAYRQLEQLIAENLPEKGQIKEFYQRISDILRHYIENRFGLHAPEQTTEEFLAALGADTTLAPSHKTLLKHFLQHCDLVKFAKHEPTAEDIQQTFNSCKNFIAETRENQEPPPIPASPPARKEGVAA